MNCQAVAEAEKNMVFAARLTQQGHKIASMDDLMELYEKSFSVQTVAAMGALPHPTIQKFAVITVAIVCASRRFLAQITRHQNEVKFMRVHRCSTATIRDRRISLSRILL